MGRALALELAVRSCAVAIADVGRVVERDRVDAARHEGQSIVPPGRRGGPCRDGAVRRRRRARARQGDLVFNNAGVSVTNTVEKLSYDVRWLMNINFWGVVHGTKRSAVPAEVDGHIMTRRASSAWSHSRARAPTTRRSSRCAVHGALRQELAGTHIGVSCVQPGSVKTNIVKTSRYYATDNEAPTKKK
jgi:NADP-dependent 3-hydroxy acid dehydrogenase YdfG